MIQKDTILKLAEKYFQKTVNIRRDLHKIPEISFKEFKTSKYIQNILNEIGLDFRIGYFLKTAILGEIKGKTNNLNKITLRADIDALPIKEETKLPFSSTHFGCMHACGHDVHTASLLGTLMILNEIKEELQGTIQFLFQPGEEVLPGGASYMVKEEVLKNSKSIYGQHVFPELKVGKVGFRPGMYMASSDEIYIEIKGKGGHAALPENIINPIVIASQLIIALQTITSKNSSLKKQTILSFGKIEGLGKTNIIPDVTKIEGTFRTMNETWREEAHFKIKRMCNKLCSSFGAEVNVEIKKGYPALFNDEKLTLNSIEWAKELLGDENVEDLDLRMTSEDFAYYTQKIPACFYRLGVRNPNQKKILNLHSSTFDIDESAFKTSISLMSWLAIKQLNIK